MHLDYLDQLIPKRWILLIRYWLPFFKTPSNFYFRCRDFIDKLKHSGCSHFPWEKFPNLLSIFEKNVCTVTEKKIAREIISKIFTRENKTITLELLILIFDQFDPDNKQTSILKEVLQRIPTKFYLQYFSTLNAFNCS